MAEIPSLAHRPLVAHHAPGDCEKRAFVDAIWRIWAKGATRWWIDGSGFVGLPEDPPEMKAGAYCIPVYAGFHAVRHAREVGLAAQADLYLAHQALISPS